MPLALVTGASSGIGEQVARLLARRGYRTLLIARRLDRLQALAKELSELAPSVPVPLDLMCQAMVASSLRSLQKKYGPIDVVVNGAGFGMYKSFLDLSQENVRQLMQIHYFTPATIIRGVLPEMLERRRGHIINIASIATKSGPWGHSAYAAAKSALVALTQSLETEYGSPGRPGIHFSYVNPGIVKTEFFDRPCYVSLKSMTDRHGVSAACAARYIVQLLDRPKLEICIPKHYRIMDWLQAFSPRWTSRLVAAQSRPKRQD